MKSENGLDFCRISRYKHKKSVAQKNTLEKQFSKLWTQFNRGAIELQSETGQIHFLHYFVYYVN